MDKVIEWVLAQYGVIGIVILTIVIVLFKFSTPIINKLRGIFWKELNYNNRPSKIIKYKMIYWKDFKIQNISIKDEGRRKILRDLLKIKFRAIQNEFVTPMQNIDTDELDSMAISQELVHNMAQVGDLYESEARDGEIPEVVIEAFNDLHSTTLEKFNMNCLMILESNGIYKSNEEKIEAITSLLIVLLELTIVDVERALAHLNGELTGVTYKGVECG